MTNPFTESTVEKAVLERAEGLRYALLFGPVIAPGESANRAEQPEHSRFLKTEDPNRHLSPQVILQQWLAYLIAIHLAAILAGISTVPPPEIEGRFCVNSIQ